MVEVVRRKVGTTPAATEKATAPTVATKEAVTVVGVIVKATAKNIPIGSITTTTLRPTVSKN